mgnify:CR=1 FL=1
MNLYILRHGETGWNKEEIFRGRKDVPLNDMGLKQAQRVARFFSINQPPVIYSSPLVRAWQTAEGVSSATGVRIEAVDEFSDMAFGPWEGRLLRDVAHEWAQDLGVWMKTPHKFRLPGAETLLQVRKRVATGLHRIVLLGEETVLIVTHRVICKVIIMCLLHMENRHFWDFRFDPASISLITGDEKGMSVAFLNNTCHLKDSACERIYRDF